MTLHRQAAKRDSNEPAIRRALHERGWHSEPVSAKGFPDLITWAPLRRDALLVDVKMPGEKATEAQEEKWQELLERGIRVYVLETLADVDAFCLGRHEPWIPSPDAAPTKVKRAHERKAKVHKPGVSKAGLAEDMCLSDFCLISKAPGSTWCLKHGPKREAKGARHPEGCGTWSGGECTCGHGPRGQIATTPGADRKKACGCLRKLGRCEHSGPYAPPQTKRPDASALAAATFAPPMRCGCTIEVECLEHAGRPA